MDKVQKIRTPPGKRLFHFSPPPFGVGKKIQVAVVYPGPAQEGATSLAVHQLIRIVNDHPMCACEPVFFHGDTPCGFVTGRALGAFDLLAFSFSFEEQFVLLPHILQLGGLGVLSDSRLAADPLVIAGGVACRLNPKPISPFLDALVAGDAEPVVNLLLDSLAGALSSSKSCRLSGLESIEGLWVSGSTDRAKAVWHDQGPPVAQLATVTGAGFDGVLLVETGRGCPAGCRFCALGFSRRPPMFYSAQQVLRAAMPGIRRGERIGLVGASLGRHPELASMVEMFEEHGADLTPASLDPMVLGTPEGDALLRVLQQGHQRSITLAPEAGSARLRKVINKPFDDDVLVEAVDRLARSGVIHIKLYLMYGLPTEQLQDLHDMISLVSRVRSTILSAHKARGGTGRFSVSLNPFVPKPHTPFQFEPMLGLPELRKSRDVVVSGLRKLGGVSIGGISPKRALFQCLLDRVDETAVGLLMDCKGKWPPASGLLRRAMPQWENLVNTSWSEDREPPWSMVDVGISKNFLQREHHRAYEGRITSSCSSVKCTACAACSGLPHCVA